MDKLLLISGNDIPFIEGGIVVHQPRLKEIAYITEKTFWTGYEVLKFDKNTLNIEEKELENISNFQMLITLLSQNNNEIKKIKNNILSFLSILFPTSKISLQYSIKIQNIKTNEMGEINEDNFDIFKTILNNMFCLGKENKQYNPSGDLAKRIANKIKKGKQKRAQLGPKTNENFSFFSRYISILATAKMKSINEIMDYTVYQLMDEFNRYMLYKNNQQWFKMKIAGATGLKDPQDWLKDMHQEQKQSLQTIY